MAPFMRSVARMAERADIQPALKKVLLPLLKNKSASKSGKMPPIYRTWMP
jgi:hypothetical protein